MSQLELTLDGQSLRPQMSVRSKLNRSLTEGAIYQRLRITARPPRPLAPGVHKISVVAPINAYSGHGPGVGRATWTFSVAPGQKDDGDDEREDDEGDDWI